MYRTMQPSPMTFLTDRTHQSIQQQNTATPSGRKSASVTHNPYGASVIPENPEEVLLHRSMSSQMDAYGGYHAASCRSPYAVNPQAQLYGGQSPLSFNNSFVEFPPISPMVSSFRGASPYAEPPAMDSMPAKQSLTKVYVGGRPVAVPSAHQAEAQEVASSAPAMNIPNELTVKVQFRRAEGRFLMRDVSKKIAGLNITDVKQLLDVYVIVDGDRGEDLGRVVCVDDNTSADDTVVAKIPKVQRIASREEILRMETTLRQEELRALEFAQQQVQRLFPTEQLSIEDATFQFDKQKLTLWYRVPDRVYFVPLLKTLNQAYRCRIWMERLDFGADS
jgi:hypothetical protein